MAKNKRTERIRCTLGEREVAEKVLAFLRQGVSMQPIDKDGNLVLEPLRIEPAQESVAAA